jgi:hypothetical protein
MNELKIHQSGLKKFIYCQRQWFITDPDHGLGYGKETVSIDRSTGSIFHWSHHFYYGEGHLPFGKALAAGVAKYLEELADKGIDPDQEEVSIVIAKASDLAGAMLAGYVEHWSNPDELYSDPALTVLATEKSWEVPFRGSTLAGRFDAIVRDANDYLWVLEVKTGIDILATEVAVNFSWQPYLYAYALSQLYPDEKIGGVIYSTVKRANPHDIKLLKSGLPSTAQEVLKSTTEEIYRATYETALAAVDRDLTKAEKNKYNAAFNWFKIQKPVFFRRFAWDYPGLSFEMEMTLNRLCQQMELAVETGGRMTIPNWRDLLCLRECPVKDVCMLLSDGHSWEEIVLSLKAGKVDGET